MVCKTQTKKVLLIKANYRHLFHIHKQVLRVSNSDNDSVSMEYFIRNCHLKYSGALLKLYQSHLFKKMIMA